MSNRARLTRLENLRDAEPPPEPDCDFVELWRTILDLYLPAVRRLALTYPDAEYRPLWAAKAADADLRQCIRLDSWEERANEQVNVAAP